MKIRLIESSNQRWRKSWQTVSPLCAGLNLPQPPKRDSLFPDAQHAWAAYRTYDHRIHCFRLSSVWRTQDGGQELAVSQAIETERLAEFIDPLQFYFLDEQQGWLLTGHGAAAGMHRSACTRPRMAGRPGIALEMLSPDSWIGEHLLHQRNGFP